MKAGQHPAFLHETMAKLILNLRIPVLLLDEDQ